MDIVQELITQGGLGLMAGVFLWLYIQERKDHKETGGVGTATIEATSTNIVSLTVELL